MSMCQCRLTLDTRCISRSAKPRSCFVSSKIDYAQGNKSLEIRDGLTFSRPFRIDRFRGLRARAGGLNRIKHEFWAGDGNYVRH